MGDVEQVQLAEDDAQLGAGEAPDRRRAEPRGARTRLLRRVALVAAGVLLLGLVSAQLVIDAHERARLARYADVPGVLAPLRPDLRVRWRTTDDDLATSGWLDRSVVGDVLLSGGQADAGAVVLQAVDAATGEARWSRTFAPPGGPADGATVSPPRISCVSPDQVGRTLIGTPAVVAPDDDTAFCVLDNPTLSVDVQIDAQTRTQLSAGYTTLLVLDAGTGEVTERVDLPYGVRGTLLADGYVTQSPDVLPDATWSTSGQIPSVISTISRYVWGSGEPRWSFRTEATDPADGAWLSASSDGRRTSVSVGTAAWLLDDGTGTASDISGSDDLQWAWIGLLPLDAALVTTTGGDGMTGATLVTSAGERRDLGRLSAIQPYPDDGSAAGLLLARVDDPDTGGGALTAVDVRTGQRRWTSDAEASWSMIVLDGVVYSFTSGRLWAVDASDGSVLWSTLVPHTDGQLLTDGAVVVVSAEGRLDAYDCGTGTSTWSAAVVDGDDGPLLTPVADGPTASPTKPDGTRWSPLLDAYVSTAGRRLSLVTSSGGLVMLG